MRLSYDPALFTLTPHAVQRMQDRYLSWKTMEDALRDGYRDGYDGNRIILRHRWCGIRVVIEPDTAEVVTVMPPRRGFHPSFDRNDRRGGPFRPTRRRGSARGGTAARLPAEVPDDCLQRGKARSGYSLPPCPLPPTLMDLARRNPYSGTGIEITPGRWAPQTNVLATLDATAHSYARTGQTRWRHAVQAEAARIRTGDRRISHPWVVRLLQRRLGI